MGTASIAYAPRRLLSCALVLDVNLFRPDREAGFTSVGVSRTLMAEESYGELMLRVLITTTGSSGDINPFVAVGLALRDRGHEVLILANPHAEAKVLEAGLSFRPFGRDIGISEIASNPGMMDAKRGPRTVWRDFVLPDIPAMIETAGMTLDEFRPDVALSHHIFFGTQWLCAARGIPCVQVALSPIVWFSRYDSSVLQHWEPDTIPVWYASVRRRASRVIMRWAIDGSINRIRRRFRLGSLRGAFVESTTGGAAVLGLWSKHFRAPEPDDPTNAHTCGFCWFDRQRDQETDTGKLQAFLDAGDPPIVFCLGSTAVHVANDFYHHAAEACHLLKRRGLLLTGKRDNHHLPLTNGVCAMAYAPLSIAAARGCVTIHHGGAGTTAHAMRAGKPTVIVPFAHDQFDNAARAKRLGVSATLSRDSVSAVALAQTIRPMIEDDGYASRATTLGEKLTNENGAQVAADHLEALTNRSKK